MTTIRSVHAVETTLPTPHTERWQPLRLGLVDLFYYDYQEFWFRDGRLLLRGNNGTGKSKVLALTLPFLLDGEVSANRVEPDGDPGKRMDWNLLLGGQHTDRLGYTWLEFGRLTPEGTPEYRTLGCGLKAAQGRGIADRWYFVTPQRVGQDLFLISHSGTALGRDRLAEALGTRGYLTQRAEQYRRAVDEQLFQLGVERYNALVALLIQLRQPQLSKRPDPRGLSRALSQALPPVDDAVLGDVAAAFHDLEQQRDELTGLRETRGHVGRFLTRYQRYAQVAARRQESELRSAQSAYESVSRDLTSVRDEIEQKGRDEQEASERLNGIAGELAELAATRDELASRPELKNVDDAERVAQAAERAASEADGRAQAAARVREHRHDKHDHAVAAVEASRSKVRGAADSAEEAARAASLTSEHAAAVRTLELPDGPEDGASAAIDAAEQATGELADRRSRAVAHVLDLAETASNERTEATAALGTLRDRESDRDAAADRRQDADQAVEDAIGNLVAAWREYVGDLAELTLPDPDEIGLSDWAASLEDDNPAHAALRDAETASHQRLARSHAEASGRWERAETALREFREEQARLQAGEQVHPPVPHTRPDGARDERSGAPLWQVVDFRDDLDVPERAGLEAALESAGLLDAWVTPDGRLLEPGTHDTVVTAAEPVTSSLAEALRPAVDRDDPQAAAISTDTVAAVLSGLGYGETAEAAAWVDPSGGWQVGPLHGSWGKDAAEYVGHGSREEARRRRLAELEREIDTATREEEACRHDVSAVEGRQRTLSQEVRGEPSDQSVRDKHSAAASAVDELERAQERVDRQAEAATAATERASASERARDEAAGDLALPAEPARLREVEAAIAAYRTDMAHLVGAARAHRDALGDLATWAQELRSAQEALEAAESESRETAERARGERARLAALKEAIGATVEEIQQRLTDTKEIIGQRQHEHEELTKHREEVVRAQSRAEGREQELSSSLTAATERRDDAVLAFYRFAATGLLAVAVPDLELPDTATSWAVDPAVRLARRAEQALSEVDDGDEAWKRVQDEVTRRFTELAEALSRHGHQAAAGLEEDRYVVTITFQGRERAPGELAELLDGEIDYRERMLTAKERELLEEHLVNDVASHLQQLISEAEAQVAQMNAELAERPTSTGMRVRLRWDPSPQAPDGLAEARARLLRQDADLWSPEDRAAVSEFLQRQIEVTRNHNDTATWQENLAEALDYRAWHEFAIERWQDGRWRSASAPASGGERVLTVTLPLFAAASSHYRSAGLHAPRLVLLDEAFAGVDDNSRAKALGLLATFDLDVAMTSEREWGFYATVPGIATHQLARREGIDAVHVTSWEWDGSAAHQVEQAVSAREPGGNGDNSGGGDDTEALW